MTRKTLLIATILLFSTGCWNGENTSINLGTVSIGQQLIDLKRALDEGAMTQEEYDQTKQTLLKLNSVCQNTDQEEE
jgi:hypothetical protein